MSEGADFAEARVDRYVLTYFNVVDGVVKDVIASVESGASLRSCTGGPGASRQLLT